MKTEIFLLAETFIITLNYLLMFVIDKLKYFNGVNHKKRRNDFNG